MSLLRWTPAILVVSLLVAPSLAGAVLSETTEAVWTAPEAEPLRTKAAELSDVVAIYEYVRNEYRYALYHGARSNSANTFHAEQANDVDLASLLIAMLRSQGIESRYAVGTIKVPGPLFTTWLGVEDVDLAHSLLVDVGIPNVVMDPGGAFVELEHAWVQAHVPWTHYRGVPADATDCTAMPEACTWIDLDPSFKSQEFPDSLVDVHDVVVFDYDAYYHALDQGYASPDGVDRAGKNPFDIYEEQVLAYLRGLGQGQNLSDVARAPAIAAEAYGVLPASLPFEVVGPVGTYDSVAQRGQGGSRTWQKFMTATLVLGDAIGGPSAIELPAGSAMLADLSTKRFSIAYESGIPDRVVARLDDVELASPIAMGTTQVGGQLVVLGDTFHLKIEADDNEGAPLEPHFQNHVVGAHIVLVAGGATSNRERVHRVSEELLLANEQFPIVNDLGGVPYVDENLNGVADSEDTALLDHPLAMAALTGGLLELAGASDVAYSVELLGKSDALLHTVSPFDVGIAVTSTVHDVEYIDDTPFAVLPGGLFLNAATSHLGPYRVDAPDTFSHSTLDLQWHALSAAEHEVWTELLGYDAVSTVNGFQRAVGDGATMLDVEVSETVDELAGAYGSFGFSSSIPAGYTVTQWDAFGTRPWTFTGDATAEPFHMFRAMPAQGDPEPVLNAYYYDATQGSNHYAFIESYKNAEAQLLQMIQNGQTFQTPQSVCALFGTSTNPAVLLDWLDDCYFYELSLNPEIDDLFQFLDENNGMNLVANVYRTDPAPDPLDHDVDFVLNSVRGFLYFVEPGYTNRVIVPDQATVGPNYRFNVHIAKRFDPSGIIANSYAISNQSTTGNGGYTRGDAPVDPANDLDGYNNSLFTHTNLVADNNNDPIVTPSTADPVAVATGNMYLDETDLVIKSIGMNLVLTRTYNSNAADLDPVPGPLGPGWTHSYLMHLEANDEGLAPDDPDDPANSDGLVDSITYRDERGGEAVYAVDPATGATTPPGGTYDELAVTVTPGLHEVRFRNGIRYVFEGPDLTSPGDRARLKRIEDPYGNFIRLTYNGLGQIFNVNDAVGVADPLRRGGISFIYISGLLRNIVDWTGRVVSFTYDGEGRLETATNTAGHTTTYTYSSAGLLEDVILPADRDGDGVGGDVRTHFTYYRNGRAFSNANSLGFGETLTYNYLNKSTRVSDPRGFVREFHYDRNGLLTELREPDGGILLFDHTDDYHRYRRIDALGYETLFSYQQDRSITTDPSDTFGNVTLERDPLGNTVETDYDYALYDQPVQIKDRNGGVTRLHYYQADDPITGALRGKLHYTEMETLNGVANVRLREFTYNPNGTVDEVVEYIEPGNLARHRTLKRIYSPDGLDLEEMILTGTDGTMRRSTLTYDALGRRESQTLWRRASPSDPTLIPLTTTYSLDDLDRVESATDALGNRRETEFDENAQVKELRAHYKRPDETFDTRILEQRFYDLADRVSRVVDPRNGATTSRFYDEAGNLVRAVGPLGSTTTFELDEQGRTIATVDENGHRSTVTYDLAGRVVTATDANGNTTSFELDALGRAVATIDALQHRSETEFYPDGQVKRFIDANAEVDPTLRNAHDASLYAEYDELGRLSRTVDALDGETSFEYDLLGNRTQITDAESQVTEFVFDDIGRLREVRDPIVESPVDKVVTLEIDEAGNVFRRTDRKGQVSEVSYDVLNRPLRRDFLASGHFEERSYDLYGNLDWISNGEVTYDFEYDDHDRVERKTDSRFGLFLEFEYDLVGRLESRMDYQGDTTFMQYDGTGRLVAEENDAFLQVSYHYDPAGRLLDRILSNGARTSYGYDSGNRMTAITNRSADGTIVHWATYGHDRVGNITNIGDRSGATALGYDPLHRLTSEDYPGGAEDRGYTYDGVGNRETKTVAGVTQDYIYSAGNRLDEIRDLGTGTLLAKFIYDDNGAIIERQNGGGTPELLLVRDDKGRVASASGPGFGVAHGYDPRGTRIRKDDSSSMQLYHLDGVELDAIYDEAGGVRSRFLRGAVVDEIVNTFVSDQGVVESHTVHHDHVKSVVAVTGHDGAPIETLQFSAFGESMGGASPSEQQFRYAGREFDSDSGLYYNRARYYDPELGRFMSPDPIGFDGGQANFYVYVANNPLLARDPSGNEILLTAHEVVFGIGGVRYQTNEAHLAIMFVPESQDYWSQSPRVRMHEQPLGDGRQYFTISGSATGTPLYLGGLGDLSLVFNKESDIATSNFIVGRIEPPLGMSENQYISVLLEATFRYNNGNQVEYDLNPESRFNWDPDYNSTSASLGLLAATGGRVPPLARIPYGTSGSANLVPAANFGLGTGPPMGSFGPGSAFDPIQTLDAFLCGFCPAGPDLGPGPWLPDAAFLDYTAPIPNWFSWDYGGSFVVYPSSQNASVVRRAYAK